MCTVHCELHVAKILDIHRQRPDLVRTHTMIKTIVKLTKSDQVQTHIMIKTIVRINVSRPGTNTESEIRP